MPNFQPLKGNTVAPEQRSYFKAEIAYTRPPLSSWIDPNEGRGSLAGQGPRLDLQTRSLNRLWAATRWPRLVVQGPAGIWGLAEAGV